MGHQQTDVLILGGGLAGLTLARQLRMEMPELDIIVLERSKRPAPEACYKVGESSVEVAAHYFAERLELREHIDNEQLPKLGLRYFFPQGENRDVTKRFEIGPSEFPVTPSYQLDRGRFENYLHELNVDNGIEIHTKAKVQQVTLNSEEMHEVKYMHGSEVKSIQSKWLVDATGRNQLIKRKLNLEKDSNLHNDAVWFRLDAEVDIGSLSDVPQWQDRAVEPRRLSTNHFMGPGYWLWFIPLGSGATSVGIVFDNQMHNFKDMNNFEKALNWLYEHEPQCAELVESYRSQVMDFIGYRNYSYSCKQVFSADRWCITGESGVFIDPFYSPGSDFIAYSNDFVTELIVQDFKGKDIRQLASSFNDTFMKLADVVSMLYEGLYPKFGNGFVMKQKILWDSVIYLGVTCLLYFNRKFTDPDFLALVDSELAHYNYLLRSVAEHFKRQPITHDVHLDGEYVDLTKTFLFGRNLNEELTIEYKDDDALIEKLRENIELLDKISVSIFNNVDIAWNFQPKKLADTSEEQVVNS
ncbi:NAD(P)/FAD-dependent oxidoreductase [Vibrio rhizosphaerae]|uniref:NAD(P)/FAD-dependent oxidoreductase n=1 Tax=Vibrio rhizosphaerae TaxID=398736 RepID=UPI00056F2732|nr:tryptophan 7-halogenase [Vibrio rhizosphaerae]